MACLVTGLGLVGMLSLQKCEKLRNFVASFTSSKKGKALGEKSQPKWTVSQKNMFPIVSSYLEEENPPQE